jgi:hypothetical protein
MNLLYYWNETIKIGSMTIKYTFFEVITLNLLAQRGPDEAAERPHQEWESS